MKHIITWSFLICILTVSAQQQISGKVYWPSGEPMLLPATAIVEYINGGSQVYHTATIPIENGIFSQNLVINPLITTGLRLSVGIEEGDPRYRVSVLDILRIRNHILGNNPISDALRQYAADANNSYSISAIDLVEIRKVILGLYSSWPNKKNISFFHRPDATLPAPNAILVSEVYLDYHIGTDYTVDFWAVKTGDVNK